MNLTDKHYKILNHIVNHIKQTGKSPNRGEISEATGIKSYSAISLYLMDLENEEYIVRGYRKSRGIKVLKSA